MFGRCLGVVALAWLVGGCTVAESEVPAAPEPSDPRIAAVLDRLEAVRAADVSDELKEQAQLAVHQVLKTSLSAQLYGSLISPIATRGVTSNALALVVGNGNYRHLPTLPTAVADAEAVAEILAQKYGFDVTLLRDATRHQLLAALERYRATVGPADDLLIFYSGHSERAPHDGTSYWLPVDAAIDDTASWVSTRAVADVVASLPARQVLVVADAAWGDVLTPHALGAPMRGRARTVLSAGALAPALDASGGAHSVFSQALLDTLGSAEAGLRGQQLESEVVGRMTGATQNFAAPPEPRYGPMPHAGHEGGDFVLAPAGRPGEVEQAGADDQETAPPADRLLVVDCLVHPVRRLSRVEFPLPPPRPVRTSAFDCERRGGEFVAYSAADPANALRVWLDAAEAGDPKAQTHVGEAFERGPYGAPDYAEAARWYRRAAEAGYAPAHINLGHLYEHGLGVPRDEALALDWYRRAAQAAGEVTVASVVQPAALGRAEDLLDEREIARLQRQIARLEQPDSVAPAAPAGPDAPVITVIDPNLAVPGEVVAVRAGVERRQIVGRVDAPAGLLSLSVNDRPLPADAFPMFRAEVPVAAAGTRVEVVAIDRLGRRADLSFALQPAAQAGALPPPAAGPGDELQALVRAVGEERPAFARPAFQCLDDLRQCGRAGFAWFDCQLTMLVCVFDLALP